MLELIEYYTNLTGYDTYIAEEVIGKGGYAKVWKISCFDYMNEDGIDNKEQIVMKVTIICLSLSSY